MRDILNGVSNVVNHLRYDSFGRITSETNAAVDFLFAFTGRERDEESGLYYYRARYYDPAVGRFVSEDPLGFAAGDGNLTRYVNNSPNISYDPTGLQTAGSTIIHTRLKDIDLYVEWFPHIGEGKGQIKIIKVIGNRTKELAQVELIKKAGKVIVESVRTHGGRVLPGIGGSKVGKIVGELNEAVEIIIKKSERVGSLR